LNAYLASPPDHDFAVHHLAVAVEHLSKAYLCSVSEVLLATDKPTFEDLLILSGNEDKANKSRAGLRTIGGDAAISRAERLLGKRAVDADGLRRLRESRNGITHMGLGEDAPATRALLAAGIQYISDLLAALSETTLWFWGEHEPLTRELVEEAVTELQLRYNSKLQRAQALFRRKFDRGTPEDRERAISAMASLPVPSRWFMVATVECPACGSPGVVSGRDHLDEFGAWFSPRHFGCRVCELDLEADELPLADIKSHRLNDEDPEDDWEPDFELM
jgi:hypothetical protein